MAKAKKAEPAVAIAVKEWHFPRLVSVILNEAEMQPTLPEAFARWVKMEEYPPDCILVHCVGNNDQWRESVAANRFSAYRNAGAGEEGRLLESEAAKYDVIAILQVDKGKNRREFYGIWRPRVDIAA